MSRYSALLILALFALPAGCGAPYVNIPPLAGDTAFHDPNDWNVLDIEVAALKHLIQVDPPPGQYAVTLPQRTDSTAYNWVLGKLPTGGSAVRQPGEPIPVYAVSQISVRGWHSQVDIVRPGPMGEQQLVTLYLSHGIDGWYVERIRPWRVPVNEALAMSRRDYIAAAHPRPSAREQAGEVEPIDPQDTAEPQDIE